MTVHGDAGGPLSLNAFDSLLGGYPPFADSEYIRRQLQLAYERRLGKISTALPIAGQLLDALSGASEHTRYRVLGDTVLRCTVQQALRQIVTGVPYGLPLSECDQIFQRALAHTVQGRDGGLLEQATLRGERLGPEPWHGLIWDEDGSSDLLGSSFRFIVRENYGEALITPSRADLAIIRQAAGLLNELVPALARSALSHAHTVAVFPSTGGWKGKASSSQYRVSGTIFLNRDALHNPWWVAEHLLHESLHQKLYDFRHGHSLLNRDSLEETTEETLSIEKPVLSIWNIPGLTGLNLWDTHRAVAAFHVYVHLSLLTTLAEQRAAELEERYGPLKGRPPVMTASRKAFERAHYLGEKVKECCWDELGLAGQWLVDWLNSVLDSLDSSPPPPGSYVHLLLDRYVLEVKHVAQAPASPRLDAVLTDLTETELTQTDSLLLGLGRPSALRQLQARPTGDAREAPVAQFGRVRDLIAQTLREAVVDGYSFQSATDTGKTADALVLEMVERSSHALATVLEEAPAPASA